MHVCHKSHAIQYHVRLINVVSFLLSIDVNLTGKLNIFISSLPQGPWKTNQKTDICFLLAKSLANQKDLRKTSSPHNDDNDGAILLTSKQFTMQNDVCLSASVKIIVVCFVYKGGRSFSNGTLCISLLSVYEGPMWKFHGKNEGEGRVCCLLLSRSPNVDGVSRSVTSTANDHIIIQK